MEAVLKLSGFGSTPDSPNMKMLDAFWDKTEEHPLDHRSRLFGDCSITLVKSSDGPNFVRLSDIVTLNKGSGACSRALKMICDLADEYDVDIELSAKSYGRAHLTNQQLVDWYSRYGFEDAYPDEAEGRWPEFIEEEGLDMLRKHH